MSGMLSSVAVVLFPEYTSVRMRLHAETPVGPAERRDMPLVAFMSSVTGLLALEQLAVHRETCFTADGFVDHMLAAGHASTG